MQETDEEEIQMFMLVMCIVGQYILLRGLSTKCKLKIVELFVCFFFFVKQNCYLRCHSSAGHALLLLLIFTLKF